MNISITLVILAVSLFVARRLLQYLRFLQQDEYAPERFMLWLKRSRAYDSKGTVVALAASVSLLALPPGVRWLGNVAAAGALIWISYWEPDPRISGKVKLVMTERANRIYRSGLMIAVLAVLLVTWLWQLSFGDQVGMLWLFHAVSFQLTPFCLIAAVRLLQPGEKNAQEQYLREAKAKIDLIRPDLVAVTGSYGKTSVKKMLGELLQVCLGPTFLPRDGVNTIMGNTRFIREKMLPAHRYAVIEMGAYRKGSIKAQCDLVKPRAALITAIGVMHLERFGTEEAVFQAKTELARALPADGLLVCNGDDPGALRAAKEYPSGTTLLYGIGDKSSEFDCFASDVEYGEDGICFKINWKGQSYQCKVGMVGKPALSNLLGAFTVACGMGAQPEFLVAAMSNIEPVKNRLSMEKRGDVTFIHDAYNSNPAGFESALEVLGQVPGKRKILMTPGMIELGKLQQSANKEVAARAAEVCDMVLVVGSENKKAFLDGLGSKGFNDEKILIFKGRDEAFSELGKIQKDGDVILIENDLPDWHEADIRF